MAAPVASAAPTWLNCGIIEIRMLRVRPPLPLLYVIPVSLLLMFLMGACGDDENEAETTPLSTPTAAPTKSDVTPSPPATEIPAVEGIVRLPHDEGAHLTPIEWWYFNGHLDTQDGRTFSYHFVTFQSVLDSGLTPRLMQLSWADHDEGIHLVDEQAAFPQVEATSGAFDLAVGSWRMSGDGESFDLSFTIGDYVVDLQGESTKAPALHYETGYVDLGIAGKTYYYSHTDVETVGTVSVGGSSNPVTGIAWMDHQWGDFTTAGIGWDWFSLNLDDGSDLKVSVVWELEDGRHIETYGTYVPADGQSAVHLPGDDISVESTDTWTSTDTDGEYPMGWKLRVDSLGLDLMLTPVIREAEYAESKVVPVIYWEGAVEAEGARSGSPVSGRGFVEMVGYAPSSLANLPTPSP